MARIVIAAFGTRGDVAPLTGIGCRLQQAGHEVVVTAPSMFSDLITGCGLRSLPHDVDLNTNTDLANVRHPQLLALKLLSPNGMHTSGKALLTALRDEPADILLLSPLVELVGHPLAEARGIPSIGVRLQPLSTTANHPPSLLGAWSAGPRINQAAGRLATATIDRLYAKTVAAFRDQLGLPSIPARALQRQRTAQQWPVLHGFSPAVVPRPTDWRPGLEVVGYWWPPRPLDWQPPAELVTFLDSGTPPVFLSFGSLLMATDESARLSELVPRALRMVGVRGVIQTGWAGLNTTSDDVLTIGDAPHDWLFERVAGVVHACGAGTTGAGLRAGVPAIGIPAPGGDQPFWARRLRDLHVSPATLSRRKLTAERLAAAIDAALTDPTYRTNAKQLAEQIANDDGAGQAVAAVERLTNR